MKIKANVFVSLFVVLTFGWIVTGVQATNQPSPPENGNINGSWHQVETWNLVLRAQPPPTPLLTTVLKIVLTILDQLPKVHTLYEEIKPPQNPFPFPEPTLDLIFAMVTLAVVVTFPDKLRLRGLKSVKIQTGPQRLGLLKEERGIKERRKLRA
jgi:hypothetical protein